MAIQVSGTTVIDDSRNLVNVIGLKTVNSTSLLGSGNIAAGASTTYDAVGTYSWGRPANFSNYAVNATSSGVYAVKQKATNSQYYNSSGGFQNCTGTLLSGTWRSMSGAGNSAGLTYDHGYMGLWVRIS